MRLTAPVDTDDLDLDSVDLTDPALYGDGEPHAVWQAMRQRRPVSWQPVGDLGFWSVTKFHDVERVLNDHGSFTSERGTLLNLLGREDPASGRQLAVTDPPRHTQMRSALQAALSLRSAEAHAPTIRQFVRRLLQPPLSGEPFDFASMTAQLPMATIGPMLGLPEDHWPRLVQLTGMALAPDDPAYQLEQGPAATVRRAHRELFAYFQDRIAERAWAPREDLLSLLLRMELDGRRLDVGTILSNCYSLLLGASVTVPHVPSATLLALLDDGAYERWASCPEFLDRGINEALRWSSPANHFMRHATRPVVLCGTRIEEGDAVVVWLGSANRDSEVFERPFVLDMRRQPNRHIAFGRGAHLCIGNGIAWLSLRIFFEELFAHFASFEPVGQVRHIRSNFIAGIASLPVVARPRPLLSRGTTPGRTVNRPGGTVAS